MTRSLRFTEVCGSVVRRGRIAVVATGALALATLSAVPSSFAAFEGNFETLLFNMKPVGEGIRIVSDNGKEWSRIEDTTLSFIYVAAIEMKGDGKIHAYGIYWGECAGHDCFEKPGTPLLHSVINLNVKWHDHSWGESVDFSFPSGKIPYSTPTGIALTPWGNQVIAACNEKLSQGKGIHETHEFQHEIPFTLGVDTYWDYGQFQQPQPIGAPGEPAPLSDVDGQKTRIVSVPVTCVGVPVPAKDSAAGQVATQLPPFEVIGATLNLGFPYPQNHLDATNYAGACPVDLLLFMHATSNVPGTFEARVEAASGWKSEKYTLKTDKPPAAGGYIWYKSWQDLLKIPVVIPVGGGKGGAMDAAKGIGQVAILPKPEEPIVPGKGGIPKVGGIKPGYTAPGNVHEDSLRLNVSGGGKTVYSEWRKYKIVCDPKVNPAVGDGPKGIQQAVFIQQAQLSLDPVAPKDGSKCGLHAAGFIQTNVKATVKFRLKNHQGNTTNWQTVTTSQNGNIGHFLEYLDWSSSGEGVWVTPGGGWAMPGAGVGGQAGPKKGSLQIVTETPTKFEGNIASYDFTCYAPMPVALKPLPTVTVNPDLPTSSGVLVGPKPTATGPGTGRIVDPPKIACTGGSVQNGKCVCERGFSANRTAPNRYLCVQTATLPPPQPKIACVGGSVQNFKCACERGFNAVAAGANAFRCERITTKQVLPPPQPKIVCTGGSVRDGKCACAQGFNAVAAGTNAFRCVQTATVPTTVKPTTTTVRPTTPAVPAIACRGGVVRSNRCDCPTGMSPQNGVCTAATTAPRRTGGTSAPVRR